MVKGASGGNVIWLRKLKLAVNKKKWIFDRPNEAWTNSVGINSLSAHLPKQIFEAS